MSDAATVLSQGSRPRAESRRIVGLDGLRALGVLAVVAYHLGASWVPGGFLGVDLFMVVSGFLITSLLLQELDRSGRTDIRAFWVRRAKRLLPAALTLIVCVAGLAALIFKADQLMALRKDALAAVFYVANWRFIYTKASYFALFSEASPFRHLWSLAIEEQFYLLWPLAILLIGRRPRSLTWITGMLVLGSAVLDGDHRTCFGSVAGILRHRHAGSDTAHWLPARHALARSSSPGTTLGWTTLGGCWRCHGVGIRLGS